MKFHTVHLNALSQSELPDAPFGPRKFFSLAKLYAMFASDTTILFEQACLRSCTANAGSCLIGTLLWKKLYIKQVFERIFRLASMRFGGAAAGMAAELVIVPESSLA